MRLPSYLANGERLDKPINSVCTDRMLAVIIFTVHDINHMSHSIGSTSFPYNEEGSLVNFKNSGSNQAHEKREL